MAQTDLYGKIVVQVIGNGNDVRIHVNDSTRHACQLLSISTRKDMKKIAEVSTKIFVALNDYLSPEDIEEILETKDKKKIVEIVKNSL